MNWIEKLNRVPGRVPLPLEQGLSRSAVIEVMHWAYSPALPNNIPHRHTYFEVCLIGRQGGGEFRVGNGLAAHTIKTGDLFIARPGVVHQIVNNPVLPAMELFWVSFLPNAAEKYFAPFVQAADRLVVPDTGGRLGSLWNTLKVVAGTTPGDGDDPTLTALMAALLTAIISAGGSELFPAAAKTLDPAFAAARLAVRFIHEKMGDQTLTVPDIAAAVHLSPRHLSRQFAAFAGVGPAAYIEQARLERARSLLLRTDDPIKQIAALVGFRDVYHFTRAFTRCYGCPPGRFRAEGTEKPPQNLSVGIDHRLRWGRSRQKDTNLMPTTPRTLGSGAASDEGTEFRKTEDTHVAEIDDTFDRDLHGEDRAGQHGGNAHEARLYSAYDIKELHASMPQFSDEELKQIPILAHGERLEQGGVYLDLHALADGTFRAHGGLEAQDPHYYVPKAHVDYILWNKLTGVNHGGTPSLESREA